MAPVNSKARSRAIYHVGSAHCCVSQKLDSKHIDLSLQSNPFLPSAFLVPFTPLLPSFWSHACNPRKRVKGQSLLPFTSYLRSFQARTSAYKSLTRNMSHGLPAQQGGLGNSVCWLDVDRELPEEGLRIKQKSRQIVVSGSGWFRGSDQRPRTGLRLCLCLSHVGFMLTQASPCDLRKAAATLDLASTPSPAQEERPDPWLQAWLPPHAPP